MLNFKKISLMLLTAAFMCAFSAGAMSAETYKVQGDTKGVSQYVRNKDGTWTVIGLEGYDHLTTKLSKNSQKAKSLEAAYQKDIHEKAAAADPDNKYNIPDSIRYETQNKTEVPGSSFTRGKVADYGQGKVVATEPKEQSAPAQEAEEQAKDVVAGTNPEHSASTVTGCSSNYGLFSGLIDTGRKIFKGLRDLIYVVAGFGIIGVAVGGFFGNLNWKWLGAIVIALVVIATTGEIINMITGCENFTKAMIEDTLK